MHTSLKSYLNNLYTIDFKIINYKPIAMKLLSQSQIFDATFSYEVVACQLFKHIFIVMFIIECVVDFFIFLFGPVKLLF